MVSASTDYISASANRHSQVAHSSTESLIAFGSNKLVCLWHVDPVYDRGTRETLPGHEGVVTCVRFLQEDLFFTADDRGYLRCWKKSATKWHCSEFIQAHSKAICSLAVYADCVVTGSSDSQVKAWRQISDGLKVLQTISVGGKYPLALALGALPGSESLVLAIGSTDRTVQIWAQSNDIFVRCAVLAGHEDWVRSLSFRNTHSPDDALVLASGSQDNAIRLWNIERQMKSTQNVPEDFLSDYLLDSFEASLGDLSDVDQGGRQISLKQHSFAVQPRQGVSQKFSITFDALLVGHEAGVTSLSWRPSSSPKSVPTLLSTSTDSSVILWSPSVISTSPAAGSSAIWINRQRFGDIGGQRLGGFVGGLWAHNGDEALAWGWSGGWRRWRRTNCGATQDQEAWHEVGAVGGHNAPVRGIDWSPQGEYLISVGLDQTTRIHGPTPDSHDDRTSVSWHEIGRPQVHGYDLVDVVFLDVLRFVSIADEKVARVFEAPRSFVDMARALGIAQLPTDETKRPAGATVPPLGLSNKALIDVDSDTLSRPSLPIRRPFEADLASTTLWPEVDKVFGHGYESISLAASESRLLVATACKATTPEHAVVRIYDTQKWQPVGRPLAGHTLTVTRIAFSPDDRLILSVSRDRSWRLFEVTEQSGYVPVASDRSHARIVWDCAWSREGDIFATASRDKTVRIWERAIPTAVDKWTAIETIKTEEAATAVSFSAVCPDGRRRIAIGLETGAIFIYSNSPSSTSNWRLDLKLDARAAHISHIHRLAWRPGALGDSLVHLASCSEDGTLKVSAIHVTEADVNTNPQ